MKILLIGDYSNCHSTLARGLRQQGHEVTLMSSGSGFQQTERDTDLSRRDSRIGGALLYARMRWPLRKAMAGYDVVALQNPHFAELRPHRLRYFFDRLRDENEKVFLTAAGTDVNYILASLDTAGPLKYNEFRIGNHLTPFSQSGHGDLNRWLTPEMRAYCDHVYSHIDGAVSVLYEYHLALKRALPEDKIAYGGIPIDTDALQPVEYAPLSSGVNLFLGRHRTRCVEKGTDLLEQAALAAIKRCGPESGRLTLVEDVPLREYVKLQKQAHLVMDQIYSYTPATNALLAMARGIPALSGAEPEFYDFIGETQLRPVINAPVTLPELTDCIEELLRNPALLQQAAAQSREFVIKHNHYRTVTQRFLSAWQK
ncbi:MAG: glycosyltransferase [Muribaculaceae bacterium]|nr:glycosyltransferase [Muribaculaceae bacterium]